MDCIDCTRAAAEPWWGFRMGCTGCAARSAARSPQFKAARSSGDKFDRRYRSLLEQLDVTHAQVMGAFHADECSKERA